ncbi:SDR family NAD(P)-dependent oxidoreductase [Streptomyces aurantiacus]|uniref:3-ketoacyl-ACP reductase n=1 Tax=Streptomyces aurantiacus TaxID=47760 RepID=A0A7G1P1T2_9ACTN|nr:SDR family oxidoreductase [Streptomyces aurantiacus]BCL28611.1 3-ketoacyl-ACP reductase [Streptomyces aurantiacus]
MDEADGGAPVALVTGGAGFIGSAIVKALTARGHRVVVLDRAGDDAVDLADEQQVRAAARTVLERHGRCDVLVHAGVNFERAALPDIDAALMRRMMTVNVEAPLWLLQELTPSMAEHHFGRVVMVVSDTFFDPPPVPDMLPYVMTKGALIGAARALARSLGADGITVNCVAPGMTPPPVSEPGLGSNVAEGVRSRQALPRPLVPEDVAEVVGFLVSREAEALTGQTICPDGGLVLR